MDGDVEDFAIAGMGNGLLRHHLVDPRRLTAIERVGI